MLFGETMDSIKAKTMNPIVLAFVGDAVYSLCVRELLASTTDKKSGELSEMTANVVKATSQAKFIDELMPLLTEEESDVFRRGRNAKKPSHAKHSGLAEYNKSTGFEAVIGYLYLTGNEERLRFLMKTNQSLKDKIKGQKE